MQYKTRIKYNGGKMALVNTHASFLTAENFLLAESVRADMLIGYILDMDGEQLAEYIGDGVKNSGEYEAAKNV